MLLDKILALYDPTDDTPIAAIKAHYEARIAKGDAAEQARLRQELKDIIGPKGVLEEMRKRCAPGKGNPTASAVGRCLASQQMLRFPQVTQPVRKLTRTAFTFEDGHMHAADLKHKLSLAFPGASGLEEELFYWPIEVTLEQGQALYGKIKARKIWGTIQEDFKPPVVYQGEDGKYRTRLAPRDPRHPTRPAWLGFVLDMKARTLWSPLYIDFMVRHPDYGMAVAEFKSASRFQFRKYMLGNYDLANRIQLAVIHRATGHPAVWMFKSKDTAHMLEVAFLPGLTRMKVEVMKINGQVRQFWVDNPDKVLDDDGAVIDTRQLEENDTWETAKAFVPVEEALLKEAAARTLRVLLFEADPDPANVNQWDREAWPDFRCPTCLGTKVQTLAKTTKEPLKGGPKPCADCTDGFLDEAEVPGFPCGYCHNTAFCWGPAKVRLQLDGAKPQWLITRADWLASGLTPRPTYEHPTPYPQPPARSPEETAVLEAFSGEAPA